MMDSVPVGAMVVTVALRSGSPSLSVLSPKSGKAPRVLASAALARWPVCVDEGHQPAREATPSSEL
jgi:hypothetical protein